MKQIDIAQRKLGININDNGETEVWVWAPKAKKLILEQFDGNEPVALTATDFGYHTVTTKQLKAGDQYKFKVEDGNVYPDPASLYQPAGVHGASQVFDLKAFKWTDDDWVNPALEQYIIYELHTGTFTADGTFAGIEQQLPYLKSLGITAIEIMPVAQFPGDRNWGYDGVFPFAVQSTYGGPHALQQLVNACHQHGLAVILDVVYNHLGPEGNYLDTYGHYFTDKYHTPWGDAINFDDAGSDEVRTYFIENVLMWFRDFHIDGLRLDAVHAIKDFSPKHILQEIKGYVNQLGEYTGKKNHLIVEMDLNDTRFINPIDKCGFGMDAQWVDEFHHALRVAAGNEKTGYYEDFNGLEHLAKSYQDAYVYDGMYSPHRNKKLGVKATHNAGQQFIVFSQNHDQVGNRMLGERTSTLLSFEMQKLLAGAVFCSPFIPMLFMGEEYSEPNPFLYFVNHTDPQLSVAVREGRKREFAAFHLEGEAPDPTIEDTFLKSKLQWQLLESEPHKAMHNFYAQLIAIRKQEPALAQLNRQQVSVELIQKDELIVLQRGQGANKLLCLLNFSKRVTQYTPTSVWHQSKVLLNSADAQWSGPLHSSTTIVGNSAIEIQPASVVIIKVTKTGAN